jgi:hypothetical protein
MPSDLADDYAGPSTPFLTAEDALKGERVAIDKVSVVLTLRKLPVVS